MDEIPQDGEPADDDLQDDAVDAHSDAFRRQYDNDHTWDMLQEDEHGLLRVDQTAEQRAKRQRTLLSTAQSASVRKGMIRYLLLILDVSSGASATDLRPTRLACMLRATRDFIRRFFDQNPLSQLGLLLMRNGCCEKLTELSGSPEAQIRRLEAAQLTCEGQASLQNALNLSITTLRNIPPYGHREVLFLFAALSTCDPGSIFDSIQQAKEARIRVSVVGVAAEVYVCRRIADGTGGSYGVALHEGHLEELMGSHAMPPPTPKGTSVAELVCMGFPQRGPEAAASAVFVGAEARLAAGSYVCPRCASHVGELPGKCHVCSLTLISSPHLARSYHHLFPVPPFVELTGKQIEEKHAEAQSQQWTGHHPESATTEAVASLACYGCLTELAGGVLPAAQSMVLECPGCQRMFCYECDAYVHESLHNCPGCEALRV